MIFIALQTYFVFANQKTTFRNLNRQAIESHFFGVSHRFQKWQYCGHAKRGTATSDSSKRVKHTFNYIDINGNSVSFEFIHQDLLSLYWVFCVRRVSFTITESFLFAFIALWWNLHVVIFWVCWIQHGK